MKSHIWLFEAMLRDCAMQCSVPHREWSRDLTTIIRRTEKEGLGFLSITLPTLDEFLLEGLKTCKFPATAFASFNEYKSSGLPSFMKGFLRKIFGPDGILLDDPCVTSIASCRQVFNLFKKVENPCSEKRVASALRKFVETDRAIPDPPIGDSKDIGRRLGENHVFLARRAFECVFVEHLLPLDRKIFEGEPLKAKHGPGATADRLRFNRKYLCTDWTERLSGVFSADLYTQAFECRDNIEEVQPSNFQYSPIQEGQEQPVRVITVPKTQKGPRVIAIEPTLMQYMQQGLLDGIVGSLHGTLPGNVLNFNDQSKNGRLAKLASRTASHATLDLSEASDRVPYWVVETFVRNGLPHLWSALDATRSRNANVSFPSSAPRNKNAGGRRRHSFVPDSVGSGRVEDSAPPNAGLQGALDLHKSYDSVEHAEASKPDVTVRLRKFASMGSAVCFPVEAMVFLAIVTAAIADCRGVPINKRNARKIISDVLIFGDDIIVPVDCAPTVAVWLEAFGLKLNRRKSFWTGKFRESCGVDAYDGQDVTPVYLRHMSIGGRSRDWIHRWVSFSNQLYMRGYWETARAVRKKIDSKVGPIPMVACTSSAIGYQNIRGTYELGRWDSNLHKFLVKGYYLRPTKTPSVLEGTAALRKCLMGPFNEDPEHLLSATRSSSVSMKKRWMPAY